VTHYGLPVIVNDMSEVNIDARLVADGGAELSRKEERLAEMCNGCICCTLRDDLLQEVRRLAYEGRFDYLLIESTGVSEPMPVAETFFFRDEAFLRECFDSCLLTEAELAEGLDAWDGFPDPFPFWVVDAAPAAVGVEEEF
jgi:G3E family GTPase